MQDMLQKENFGLQTHQGQLENSSVRREVNASSEVIQEMEAMGHLHLLRKGQGEG